MSSPPRWLTASQQRVWRTFLDGVARLQQELDADLRAFGLDLAEYEVLVRLSEADGYALRMSDLAGAARQSRSRLTHTVSRMEEKGLVTRSPYPGDRRGVVATLTDDGFALLDRAAPVHVAGVRRLLVDAVAPDDYEALGRAMRAVVEVPD